jgi:hypothetical protein
MKELHHTVKSPIVDTLRSDGAIFAGIEPLHSGHCLGGWRNMVWLGGQQFIAADFIDIDSSIPVFSKWDTNEHLRWMEKKEEDKSVQLYTDFPSPTAINWHLSGFESDKRQLYQRLL